jgi:hypothetical protein
MIGVRNTAGPLLVLGSLVLIGPWPTAFAAGALTSPGPRTSVYTKIDDVRTNKSGPCTVGTNLGEKDHPVVQSRCPAGPGGWTVTMFSADARVAVWFGRKSKRGTSIEGALNGAFADPHSVIEWRLEENRPFAAIQRYFLEDRQVLTVHRLNPDRTSCVAAVVAVTAGRNANAEAIQIADTIVPGFRCGDDELVTSQSTQSSASSQ